MSDTVVPSQFYFNVSNLSGSEARGKMNYITRDSQKEQSKGREQVPAYNRAGRPMSDEEREQWLQTAEENDYVQRWQVSPPNGNDLSRDELRRETRRVIDDRTRDMNSSRVAYAVHTDQDGPNHAHVLITGNENELRMNRTDIEQTRTNAHERMTQNERYRQRRQEREQEQERERQQELENERQRGIENERGF